MIILRFIQGFCMALADSVPGVSGGTVAFLLGFYDDFIFSLNNIVSGTKDERKKAITFLLKIGFGWIVGFTLAVIVLTTLFENNIYKVSSLFVGFIVFAIPIVIIEEKESFANQYVNIIYSIFGAFIVFAVTYLNPLTNSGSSIQLDQPTLGLCIYAFIAGVIAISAMVLPGISGSSLLMIFGLYIPILNALRDIMSFRFNTLLVIIVFGVGVILGILLFVRLVKVALLKVKSQMYFLIIGLMVGSLYAIMQGPTTLSIPRAPLNVHNFSIFYFIIGGIMILGLQKLKAVIQKEKGCDANG